jgi:hypothetical protein
MQRRSAIVGAQLREELRRGDISDIRHVVPDTLQEQERVVDTTEVEAQAPRQSRTRHSD